MSNEALTTVVQREMEKLSDQTDIPSGVLAFIEKISIPILNIFPNFALAVHYLAKAIGYWPYCSSLPTATTQHLGYSQSLDQNFIKKLGFSHETEFFDSLQIT